MAFDLAPGEAAANAVRLIGAAFGPAHITPAVVRAGMDAFDGGASMVQVAEAVLASSDWLAIAGTRSNTDFVTAMYRNIAGRTPDAGELTAGLQFLQGTGGTLSQAELLAIIANSEVNAVHIDLAGLQQSGVDYAV